MSEGVSSKELKAKSSKGESVEAPEDGASSKRANFSKKRSASVKDVKSTKLADRPAKALFDDSMLSARRATKKEGDSSKESGTPKRGDSDATSGSLKPSSSKSKLKDTDKNKDSDDESSGKAAKESSSKKATARSSSSKDLKAGSIEKKASSSKDKLDSARDKKSTRSIDTEDDSVKQSHSAGDIKSPRDKSKDKKEKEKSKSKRSKTSEDEASGMTKDSSSESLVKSTSSNSVKDDKPVVAVPTLDTTVEVPEPSTAPVTPKEVATAPIPVPITPRADDVPLPAPITPRAGDGPSPPSVATAGGPPAPILIVDSSPSTPKRSADDDSDSESDKVKSAKADEDKPADGSISISVKRGKKTGKDSPASKTRRASQTMRPGKSPSRKDLTDAPVAASIDTDSIPKTPVKDDAPAEPASPVAALAQHPVLRRTMSRGASPAVPPVLTTTAATPPASPRVSVSTPRTETPPPPPSDPSAPPPPPPPAPGMRRINKKELLEVSERKILTRLNNPRIDEEMKKWDRRAAKYEQTIQSERIQTDYFSDMLFFPHDDVYVEVTKPLIGRLPDVDADTPKSVRDCMAFFAQPRKVIKYRSLKYGGRVSLKERIRMREEERAKVKAAEAAALAASTPAASPDPEKKKTPLDKKKHEKKKPSMSVSSPRPPAVPTPEAAKPLAASANKAIVEDHPLSSSYTGSQPATPTPKNLAQLKLEGSASRAERMRSASVGFESLEDSASAYVLLEDLLTLNDQTVLKSRVERDRSIKGVFDVLNPSLASTDPTETRTEGRPITREYGTRVLLSMQSVHIGVGCEEAFFFSAAFYDFDKRLRLTEDFHFDFNEANDLISTLLTAQQPNQDPESKAKRGLFNLSYTSSNVYLVVRVNGLLRGPIDDVLDPYTPGNQLSAKEKQKLIDQGRTATSIMYKYQQAYAWTAVQAFDNHGHLLLGRDTSFGFWKMRSLLTDDLMFETLSNPEKKAKLRPMDMSLHLSAVLYHKDKLHLSNVSDTMLIKYPLYDVDESEAARLLAEEERKLAAAANDAALADDKSARSESASDKESHSGGKKKKSKKEKDTTGAAERQAVVKGALTEEEIRATQQAIRSKLPASMRLDNSLIEDPVKEVHEFEQSFSKPLPNTAFVNNLYVYPTEVNVSSNKVKVKSVLVRAFLMPIDGNPDKEALKVFYGTSSCPNFTLSASTTVAFEEKHVYLNDEFKIQLPLKMNEKCNLLFAIYSVNTKALNPNKKEKTGTEDLVGFAYLPVYKSKAVVRDNEYVLPILSVLPGTQNAGPVGLAGFSGSQIPPSYMETDTSPMDAEKSFLKIRTRLVSSVYAQDEVLIAYFLKAHNRKSDVETLATLDTLKIVSDRQLLHFSPVIMGQLFDLLCRAKTEQVQNRCFIAILCMVEKIFNQTMTSGKVTISEQLYNYIYCHFDNPGDGEWVYEPFTKAWLAMLKTVIESDNPNSKEAQASAKASGLQSAEYSIVNSSMKELSWFFLEIIYKSMVMKCLTTGEVDDDTTRPERFSPSFCASLKELVKYVDLYRRRSPSGFDFMNRNLALFVTDLFRVMDRGFVFDLIHDYFTHMGNETVVAIFKFRFLQICGDFEHYCPLNLPIETTMDSIESMPLKFWKEHWLAGLYLNELKSSLVGLEGTKLTRTKAIAAFRDLLWKHALDERFASREKMQRIAGLYFPLILQFSENGQSLVKAVADKKDEVEARDWSAVLLWVFQNCNWNLHLRAWWSTEGEDTLLKFLSVLKMCIDVFSGDDFRTQRDEAILTVCAVLDVFFEDFPEELNTEGSKIYEQISQLVLSMLRVCRSEMMLGHIFALLRNFTMKFKKPLFRYLQGYTLGTDLTFEVLNLCQNQPRAIILGATSILYLLLRTNSEEMGHFARMKLQSTLAISRLVKQEKCNYDELQHAMETMGGYRDPKTVGQASWHQQLRELISRHGRIIRDSVRIAQITDNYGEYRAELLYKVSLEYVNSPDLRITWLNNLANYHEKIQNFEEAAHCKTQIAALICDYLRDVAKPPAKGLPADITSFAKITPSIGAEKGLSVLWLEGTILSPEFSEDGFAKFLQEAVALFQKSDHVECAIECLLILQRYFNENKKYQQLTASSRDLATLSEKVFTANRTQSRIPPNFYRVGFYGEGFGDDNGKEFIYRENPSQRLADFTTNLVSRYEAQFGKENFQLLPNKPIDEIPNVDTSKKNYLQIVACDIYFEYDDLNTRDLTYSDRAWGVKKFVFETPYSPDGSKPTEDVSKSWKRKILLSTTKAHPFILKRIEVTKKEVKILKPIESAIDLIQTIVIRLKTALNCTPPNTKTLQIILQGSILTQVNAGPLAIVRTFLSTAKDYPEEMIEMLKDQTQRFIRSCQFGLRFNQSLIAEEPANAPLHEAMMKSFGDLRNEAGKYIEL